VPLLFSVLSSVPGTRIKMHFLLSRRASLFLLSCPPLLQIFFLTGIIGRAGAIGCQKAWICTEPPQITMWCSGIALVERLKQSRYINRADSD
jgi:hypothetical protein